MPDDTLHDGRPLAPPGREDDARRVFEGWASMSAEEWAARFGHTVGCSSFDRFRYSDASLQAWIDALHVILSDPARLEACRQRYLTVEGLGRSSEGDY
jgi:hypothetical protein